MPVTTDQFIFVFQRMLTLTVIVQNLSVGTDPNQSIRRLSMTVKHALRLELKQIKYWNHVRYSELWTSSIWQLFSAGLNVA